MQRYLMVIRTFRQLEASKPVDTQRPMWSSAPFPEMSASFGQDRKKVSLLLSRLEGPVACRDTLWLSASFINQRQASPLTRRDQCGHMHPSVKQGFAEKIDQIVSIFTVGFRVQFYTSFCLCMNCLKHARICVSSLGYDQGSLRLLFTKDPSVGCLSVFFRGRNCRLTMIACKDS